MIEYELIKSNRKTLALEIKGDRLIVRAPIKTSQRDIKRFVSEHEAWIMKHLAANAEEAKRRSNIEAFSTDEIKELADKAKQYIPQRVEYYAKLMGLTYGRITIRSQHSKWGSCSSKGNLNFNCLLMLTPPEVIDSVVVHELCHLVEMNHSQRFYELLRQYCPNYDQCRKWLKENGRYLIAKLNN